MTLLGNMNAFEELVRRYERAVKDAAYRVTGNRFSAEDAAQDALVCAWMQLSTLREKEKFGGFVCAIARHRAQDYLRRYRASIPPLSLDALLFQVGEMTDDGERLKSELREAVDALKEPVRETVKLRYFEGYSVKEIAARQALPEGTVKWRLSKGRKELRKGYGSMTYPTERPLNERKDGQGANGTMATPWEKRIMEQVERLKLYKLTLDQPGFEKDYLALLPQLLELEESREKNSACADVWWLARTRFPEIAGQKITDEQIGKAALKGRNEEVLRRLISSEIRQEYREPETALAFLRDKCIPYFREEGLQKTLGYAYYLLYGEYLKSDKTREASDALQSALGALKPDDLYYAVAMAESKALRRLAEAPPAEKAAGGRICCGGAEEYRKIEGKWYFWDAWGAAERGFGEQIFRRGEYMGRLFPDPGIPIEGRKWERERETKRRGLRFGYSHEAEGVTVTTPAGTFSDCAVFCRERRGECASCTTVQTTYCPRRPGIVRQKTSSDASSDSAAVGFGWNGEWQLSSYHVEGDDPSLIPLHTGNRFVYTPVKSECEGICYSFENRYEVLFSDGKKAIVEHLFCADRTGYADSFDGLRQKMMYTFSRHSEKKTFGEEQLRELSGIRQKLVARANGIHRQRYAEIAGEVMERIYRTGAARKPEAQAGAEAEWNIFEMVEVVKDGGRITPNRSVYDRFDWGDERYLCMEFRASVDFRLSRQLHRRFPVLFGQVGPRLYREIEKGEGLLRRVCLPSCGFARRDRGNAGGRFSLVQAAADPYGRKMGAFQTISRRYGISARSRHRHCKIPQARFAGGRIAGNGLASHGLRGKRRRGRLFSDLRAVYKAV